MGFWSGKKVTVTGGAGFLGRHIVSLLEARGADVFVPRRRDYNFVSPDASFRCLAEHPAEILIQYGAFLIPSGCRLVRLSSLVSRTFLAMVISPCCVVVDCFVRRLTVWGYYFVFYAF